MAGGIVINGRFVARPGIYSNINYLTIPGAPTQGTVLAVVGDFPFLQHNVPYKSTSQRDFEAIAPQSKLLKQMSGIIYNPLADANLTAAPTEVYLLSPRGNTQAQVQVSGSTAAYGIVAKAKQWGVMGNSTSLRITANVPRGGWDAVVSNNGAQENIRIPAEPTPLVVDYLNPISPGARPTVGQLLVPVRGFSAWSSPVPAPSTEFLSNPGQLGVSFNSSPAPVDSLRITFAREIATAYATTTELVVWEPNGPVFGQVRVSGLSPGGSATPTTLSAGATLLVNVTGIDSATGLSKVDTLTFLPGNILTIQATPTSFASVTSVSFKLTGTTPTLTGSNMQITGTCFPDMNEANGQKYVSDVLRLLQQYSDKGFLASTRSSRVTSVLLTDLDRLAEAFFGRAYNAATPVAVPLTANGWKIVTTINAASKLVTLERGNADDPSVPLASFFGRLAGGTESGVLDASDWGDALDQLVWYNIDTIAAFYDPTGTPAADDVVLAQFKDHIDRMWADGANERTLWLGAGQDENLDTLVQRAAAFNSERVNVVVDSADIQQPDGSVELMKPYWYALMHAAADASLLDVETLTRARPRVLGVSRGVEGDPLTSQEDVNELIRGGLIVSTTPPGGATRIEREVTTWTSDENPARTEAICTRSVRASTKAMRAALDSLIRPGAGVLVLADVQAQVASELERQARSVSPLITNYDARSISIVETADRYEVGYTITVRINKNFITLNVGVTVPSGTI